MPLAPPKACHVCGIPVYGGLETCPAHRKEKQVERYQDRKQNDPVHALYNHQWFKLKKFLLGCGNVLCQRIENGLRCQHVGQIWHHLVSPRINPARMYDPSNVVHVCRLHHSDLLQDDPALYVPTMCALGMAGETNPDATALPQPSKPAPEPADEPLFYVSGLDSESGRPRRRAQAKPAADPAPPILPARTWANQ